MFPFQSVECPELMNSDVHVWVASLQQDRTTITQLSTLISAEEKKQAERFLVIEPKNCFIIAHGILRLLIAKYLQLKPQDLIFRKNPHGKLFLADSSLEFNLSHSQDLVVFAFSWQRPVGVDIEYRRENLYAEDIARRFFSPAEVAALLALPLKDRKTAFFNCWSRKEAFIKAVGSGIFYGLNQFDVAVDLKIMGELSLNVHTSPDKTKNWKLYALDIDPRYAAAVVTRGIINDLKVFNV